MIIHAICTDIDGTLLDRNRELSPRTKAVFRAIPENIPIILASSRMPPAMIHLQHELGITGHPMICYNGGYVLVSDVVKTWMPLESTVIPVDVCRSVVALGGDTSSHISLYNADNWYAPASDRWTEREESITKVRAIVRDHHTVLDTWEEEGKGAHKIMCMGPAEEIAVLQRKLNEKHGADIHVYFSRSTYLELAPRSVSKASGLRAIAKYLGIDIAKTIAFGDNYNDIDMLLAAGRGVAVLNARPEVRDIAKHVTANSYDDGVAQELAVLFGLA